jgi:hypothetical protein
MKEEDFPEGRSDLGEVLFYEEMFGAGWRGNEIK